MNYDEILASASKKIILDRTDKRILYELQIVGEYSLCFHYPKVGNCRVRLSIAEIPGPCHFNLDGPGYFFYVWNFNISINAGLNCAKTHWRNLTKRLGPGHIFVDKADESKLFESSIYPEEMKIKPSEIIGVYAPNPRWDHSMLVEIGASVIVPRNYYR